MNKYFYHQRKSHKTFPFIHIERSCSSSLANRWNIWFARCVLFVSWWLSRCSPHYSKWYTRIIILIDVMINKLYSIITRILHACSYLYLICYIVILLFSIIYVLIFLYNWICVKILLKKTAILWKSLGMLKMHTFSCLDKEAVRLAVKISRLTFLLELLRK